MSFVDYDVIVVGEKHGWNRSFFGYFQNGSQDSLNYFKFIILFKVEIT